MWLLKNMNLNIKNFKKKEKRFKWISDFIEKKNVKEN